jgi:hypothetical protein
MFGGVSNMVVNHVTLTSNQVRVDIATAYSAGQRLPKGRPRRSINRARRAPGWTIGRRSHRVTGEAA